MQIPVLGWELQWNVPTLLPLLIQRMQSAVVVGGAGEAMESCSRSRSQGYRVVSISESHKNLQRFATVCGFIVIVYFPFQLVLENKVKEKRSCPWWQYGRTPVGPWGLSSKALVRVGMLVIRNNPSSWRKKVETPWLEKRREMETLWIAKVRKLRDVTGKWSHGLLVMFPCHLWRVGDKSLHFWLVRLVLFAMPFVSKNYYDSIGFL